MQTIVGTAELNMIAARPCVQPEAVCMAMIAIGLMILLIAQPVCIISLRRRAKALIP